MRQLANMLCGLVLCVSLFPYCSISKKLVPTHGGSYTAQFLKAKTNGDPVVFGRLYNYHTKKPLGTNGAVRVNDTLKARTDTSGRFSIVLANGKYKFTGFGMPYQFLSTKRFKLSKGDSLKLEIYLKVVDEPTRD